MNMTGTKNYWDSNATRWDNIYLDESPLARRMNMALRKAIYERFRVGLEAPGDLTGKTVLDVGCGSGRLAIEAVKRGARHAVGLDFAPNMLEIAHKQAAQEGVADRCDFVQGDFLEFESEEKFDVVVANGFFDYMPDPERVLRKLVSLSNGWVVASFPGRSLIRNFLRKTRYELQGCKVYFYSEQDIRRIADRAGFSSYELHFMPHSGTGYMLVGRVDAA